MNNTPDPSTAKVWDRRRFLGGVLAAGGFYCAVKATASLAEDNQPLLHQQLPPAGDPPSNGQPTPPLTPLELCQEGCDDSYNFCCQSCKQYTSRARRALCYSSCFGPYAACLAGCRADYALSVAEAANEWIWEHRNEIIAVGTIVVIAGVAMVVVSSGGAGALVLAPLL